MEPPSYEESSHQHPTVNTNVHPPPAYHPSPTTPPPTYGEAVTGPQDPFPVLTPPVFPAAPSQNPGNIIHPVSQINVMLPATSIQTPAVPVQPFHVVVTQPTPVPIQIPRLTNIPGLVQCTYCRNNVVTKVRDVPSSAAWVWCAVLSLVGLICGCCLIPLMTKSLQDTQHSCPHCKAHLFTYRR